jgi:hypothetical protein
MSEPHAVNFSHFLDSLCATATDRPFLLEFFVLCFLCLCIYQSLDKICIRASFAHARVARRKAMRRKIRKRAGRGAVKNHCTGRNRVSSRAL